MKELVSNNIASIEAQVAEESQKVMTRAEIQDMYGSELDGNPSVYCGTYGKYNNGSLFGYHKLNIIKRKCGHQFKINDHT